MRQKAEKKRVDVKNMRDADTQADTLRCSKYGTNRAMVRMWGTLGAAWPNARCSKCFARIERS
jgi:hypothetical protein